MTKEEAIELLEELKEECSECNTWVEVLTMAIDALKNICPNFQKEG